MKPEWLAAVWRIVGLWNMSAIYTRHQPLARISIFASEKILQLPKDGQKERHHEKHTQNGQDIT
ncbi:MAG TPA: hypothetical protein VJ810_39960 [Blastocatellia bacterium]|nr:hypothetical protein [Blastocatellia bacterium]